MRNKKLIVLISVVATLVLVVITCGATFLVRDVRAYSYYNYSEQGEVNYDELVVRAAGLKKNSSMFFVDEKGIKDKVEKAFNNVGVVNVERVFPDKVKINYVVYEKSFQYKDGQTGRYCQCYSSCRIGGSSAEELSDYFTLIPSGKVATEVGEYFQDSSDFDRKTVSAFIKFMYKKGLNDTLINERIRFVDLSRTGYMYIRTREGCSIEVKLYGEDPSALLDDGWTAFVGFLGTEPKKAMEGLIRVVQEPDRIRTSYLEPNKIYGNEMYTDASYYAKYYLGLS